MSKFPLMHSISTVGVIKHFNQDYLLHHTRTDFTGDNGIGKSLIADLLQILFIADSKKITFGTDSFKKKDRQVFTIPYKTNDAYFFINIEVTSKQYITLGVNIPNTSSSPIRMFRVLNNYYNAEDEQRKNLTERKKLTGYLIPEEKLLYHNDILITKNDKTEIPKISDLVRHLRDSKELFLSYFSTKAEKKELYQFLFDKNILPLNLSIDNHLNAFAKVLQAFSKANTLNTEKDKSLKSFLFDDKKEEIEAEYKHNKERLDDLVIRYGRLKKLTDDLKEKRTYLEDLGQKEKAFIEAEKLALKQEYYTKLTEQEVKLRKWNEDEKKYSTLDKEVKKLTAKLPSLEKAKKKAETKHIDYSKSLQKLVDYKDLHSRYLKKKNQIDKLETTELPDVSKEPPSEFVFENKSIEEVILEIETLKSIWVDYNSISSIEEQYKKQSTQLDELKTNLKLERNRLNQMLQLINHTNEETLAYQIIKSNKTLSKAQETILLNLFLDVKWQKPTKASDHLIYTESLDLLNESNITKDESNRGYWIVVGSLNYFVCYSDEEQIFDDINNIQSAFNQKEQEINIALAELKNRINDIENLKIDNILQYLPSIDFKWDNRIPDRRKIDEYKEAVSIIKNLASYKKSLNAELGSQKSELDVLKDGIPFEFSDVEIKQIVDEHSNQLEILNNEQTKAVELHQKTKTELTFKKQQRSELDFDADKIKNEKEDIKRALIEFRDETEEIYPKLFLNFNAEEFALLNDQNIKNDYPHKRSLFELKYEEVLKNFPTTNDDIEIKEQIDNKTFNFKLLERKLLSNANISETKNIEQALNSANEEKRKMSSTLREIMLKIFQKTQDEFEAYKTDTARLNLFFKNKLISEKYYFQVRFNPNPNFSIQWINELQSNAQTAGETGELFESQSVEEFAEEFFKDVSGYGKAIAFSDLLDPKTYFTLKTEFKDEEGNEYPGSTGESYTARVLLGIGRLSIASKEKREGLRFLILEEVASLDPSNFKTFPELAERFDYQIITMTPKPYGSNSDEGWYLHQLIKGKKNKDINYPLPNSSFKTNYSNEQLLAYLERNKN